MRIGQALPAGRVMESGVHGWAPLAPETGPLSSDRAARGGVTVV